MQTRMVTVKRLVDMQEQNGDLSSYLTKKMYYRNVQYRMMLGGLHSVLIPGRKGVLGDKEKPTDVFRMCVHILSKIPPSAKTVQSTVNFFCMPNEISECVDSHSNNASFRQQQVYECAQESVSPLSSFIGLVHLMQERYLSLTSTILNFSNGVSEVSGLLASGLVVADMNNTDPEALHKSLQDKNGFIREFWNPLYRWKVFRRFDHCMSRASKCSPHDTENVRSTLTYFLSLISEIRADQVMSGEVMSDIGKDFVKRCNIRELSVISTLWNVAKKEICDRNHTRRSSLHSFSPQCNLKTAAPSPDASVLSSESFQLQESDTLPDRVLQEGGANSTPSALFGVSERSLQAYREMLDKQKRVHEFPSVMFNSSFTDLLVYYFGTLDVPLNSAAGRNIQSILLLSLRIGDIIIVKKGSSICSMLESELFIRSLKCNKDVPHDRNGSAAPGDAYELSLQVLLKFDVDYVCPPNTGENGSNLPESPGEIVFFRLVSSPLGMRNLQPSPFTEWSHFVRTPVYMPSTTIGTSESFIDFLLCEHRTFLQKKIGDDTHDLLESRRPTNITALKTPIVGNSIDLEFRRKRNTEVSISVLEQSSGEKDACSIVTECRNCKRRKKKKSKMKKQIDGLHRRNQKLKDRNSKLEAKLKTILDSIKNNV